MTILLCNSRNTTSGFFNSPTLKMKLAAVGIARDHVGFAADHVSIHYPTELLKVSFYRLFYYVIL